MTKVFRSRLALPVLAAASSLIAISAPVRAQTACTLTGTNLVCANGGNTVVTATVDSTTTLNTALPGLTLTDADTLSAALSGTVTTASATSAVGITSSGNLALTGGLNAVNTAGPAVQLASTAGSVTATLGTLTATGGYALQASGQTGATVTTGAISATGLTAANTPVVLPVVGAAAAGAMAYSPAGPASLTVAGNLAASGTNDPVAGAVAYSPTDAATVAVTGTTTVSNGTNSAFGLAAIGATGASVNATGAVTVGSALGSGLQTAGLAALVTGTGAAQVTCGSSVTYNGANGAAVYAQGTSVAISCPTGAIAANGANSIGVIATANGTGAAGALNASLGTVTAAGSGAVGVALANGAGNTTLTAGNITATGGNNLGLLYFGGTGTAALTTGNVIATAAGSDAIDLIGSTGAITLNAAQVSGGGNGILATNGSGALTLTTTGTASGNTGAAIDAQTATGALTIREAGATGATGGVIAVATGVAPVSVTATGGTTAATAGDAIRLASLGTASTTVNAGATVLGQNGADAIDTRGAGGNTVTIGGVVSTTGAGYAINGSAGATTVTVQSGGSLSGPVLFTGTFNDTITNAGVINLSGASDFGLGTDTLVNNQSLNVNAGTTVAGLETLSNPGSLYLNGNATFTGTTLTNSSRLVATNGAVALSGFAAFNNSGLVTMVDGAANDTLTINGPYNATGSARLAVDVDGALTAADRLVINGAVSGATVVDVNLVGSTPLYNPTGVAVVTATSATGSFTLDPADAMAGFLNYNLRPVTTAGTTNYVLSSTLDPSFTDVALIGSLGQELWYQSFDAYHDSVMGRHAGIADSGHALGLTGQLYESKDRYGDTNRSTVVNGTTITYADRLRTHRRGAQLGLEFRGTGFVIGATGGYEWARNEEDPSVARLKAEGWNYGAYALFGMESGIYGGVLVKRDEYRVAFANDARAVSFENKGHSTGVDGEVGLRTGNAGAIGFDFNAGLSYVETDIDPWTQYNLNFDWQDNKSLRGRLGARVTFPRAMGLFLGAKVFHEFKDDGYLAVNASNNVANVMLPHRGTWGRLEGGISAGGAMVTVWGDVGDTRSIGGRVGFRF